eukprot:UN30015
MKKFPFSADELIAVLGDPKQKKQWDSDCTETRLLSSEPGNIEIAYESYKAPWPIKPRDFVLASTLNKKADGTYHWIAVSCEHEDGPIKRDFVRAQLFMGGWIIKPLDSHSCHVTYINHFDLGGSLPSWLVTRVSDDVPLTPLNLAEYMKKVKKNQPKKRTPGNSSEITTEVILNEEQRRIHARYKTCGSLALAAL